MNVSNPSTGTYNGVINATVPDLGVGQWAQIRLGKELNTRNCAELNYRHNGNGSVTNTLSIGFYGDSGGIDISPNETIFKTRIETIATNPDGAFDSNFRDCIVNLIYPIGTVYYSTREISGIKSYSGANYYVNWLGCKWKFLHGGGGYYPRYFKLPKLPLGNGYGTDWTVQDNGGDTGGRNSHTHSLIGDTDGHTLTTSEIPAHTHPVNGWVFNPAASPQTQQAGQYPARLQNDYVANWDAITGLTAQANSGGGGSHSHSISNRAWAVTEINDPLWYNVYAYERVE